MHDDDVDFEPFGPETAAEVLRTGEALAAAVHAYAERVAATKQYSDAPAIFQAGDELLSAALAYVDAQFEHTGTSYPLGALQVLAEDTNNDEGEGTDLSAPTSGITVLQRADFGVEDEDRVLRAGRAAYREVWPDDDEQAAAADVTHLGRALYQIAHAHGWDALREIDGLVPTGATTVVLRQDQLLGPDSDQWPDDMFDTHAEMLQRQDDVYGKRRSASHPPSTSDAGSAASACGRKGIARESP